MYHTRKLLLILIIPLLCSPLPSGAATDVESFDSLQHVNMTMTEYGPTFMVQGSRNQVSEVFMINQLGLLNQSNIDGLITHSDYRSGMWNAFVASDTPYYTNDVIVPETQSFFNRSIDRSTPVKNMTMHDTQYMVIYGNDLYNEQTNSSTFHLNIFDTREQTEFNAPVTLEFEGGSWAMPTYGLYHDDRIIVFIQTTNDVVFRAEFLLTDPELEESSITEVAQNITGSIYPISKTQLLIRAPSFNIAIYDLLEQTTQEFVLNPTNPFELIPSPNSDFRVVVISIWDYTATIYELNRGISAPVSQTEITLPMDDVYSGYRSYTIDYYYTADQLYFYAAYKVQSSMQSTYEESTSTYRFMVVNEAGEEIFSVDTITLPDSTFSIDRFTTFSALTLTLSFAVLMLVPRRSSTKAHDTK